MAGHFVFYEGYLMAANEPLAIVLVIFGFLTLVGNTLAILVYIIDPGNDLRSVSNYFVVNLAVADILVGVAVDPINASSYWSEEDDILFLFYIFAILSCVCSIVNISALMVDRFIAVSKPFRYKTLVTHKRVRQAVVATWFFSAHFALMPVVGWRTGGFQFYLYGLGVLTPMFIMLLSYYGLKKILRQKVEQLKTSSNSREASYVKKGVERERRISNTVFIMMILFTLAWGPFVLVDVILVRCIDCRSDQLRLLRDITLSMGFFSSGINPVLYAWRIPKFRKGLILMFSGGVCQCKYRVRTVRVEPLKPAHTNEISQVPSITRCETTM